MSMAEKSEAVKRNLALAYGRSTAVRGGAPVSALLTPAVVAEITGLSVETLAQWRSRRQGIPFIKISRNCVRYRQSDLDAWVAEHIVLVDSNVERRSRDGRL